MICRVCKEEKEPGRILPDLCESCTDQAMKLVSKTPEHRIGDRIAKVADALGFKKTPDCGCLKRQQALNNVDLSGPKLEVAKALLQALVNPEKKEVP